MDLSNVRDKAIGTSVLVVAVVIVVVSVVLVRARASQASTGVVVADGNESRALPKTYSTLPEALSEAERLAGFSIRVPAHLPDAGAVLRILVGPSGAGGDFRTVSLTLGKGRLA